MTRTSETFIPGDKVVLAETGERGIVIHTRTAEPGGVDDCYVAFMETPRADRRSAPGALPYVLRFAATALAHAPEQTPLQSIDAIPPTLPSGRLLRR